MNVQVKRLVGWDAVLRSARTTVGKKDLNKEPSDDFKRAILVSEHSPIRMLTYDVTWPEIPYWVAMHFRTHHIGFKASEDDVYFIQTSRSDRTETDRDNLSQTAPVICRAVLNAQSIINASRVRLCNLASKETREAWRAFINELAKIDPILAKLCHPNCYYRGFCPEGKNSCGATITLRYVDTLRAYRNYCEQLDKP